MSVEIVPIAESHIDGFHACLDAVARERRYLAMFEAPSIEQARAFVLQNIAADAAQFVAVDQGSVVGWCDVSTSWHHAHRHRGTLGIGLLPTYRGQGLGQRLIRACIEKVQPKGIVRIELQVRADNQRAITLYQRMGFHPEGLARRAIRCDGVDHDALRMAVLLDETPLR